MTRAQWDIPTPLVDALSADAEYWRKEHNLRHYRDTWSMLPDAGVRSHLLEIVRAVNARDILVPGCGSLGLLERDLADEPQITTVVATDYADVIEECRKRHKDHEKVRYEARDSTDLGWAEMFDAVIVVNSVLSNRDDDNASMLKGFARALRAGKYLLGYFPTIICAAETDSLAPELGLARCTSLAENRFIEARQGVQQIFYSPLRLRHRLREAGFDVESMAIAFMDSPYFADHSRAYYGLDDPDLCVYELDVLARKL